MSRIIKTVSLDAKSDKIASQKPNFSAWVRNQLLSEDVDFQNSHVTLTMFRQKGICNPSAAPRCNICFPHGRPTMPNIKKWNQGHITNIELVSSVETNVLAVIKEDSKVELVKSPIANASSPKQRKYIRRSLAWVWAFI